MQAAHPTGFTLDRWLPEHFRNTEDHWQAVQARVLTLLLLLYVVGFVPACIATAFAALYGALDTAVPAVITGLGSGAAAASLIHFRRNANLERASLFYACMALAMVLAVIAYTGGWQSPVCLYLLILPIIAGFAMGQTARLLYAVLVWLLYTALFLLHRDGHAFAQLISPVYSLHAQVAIWLLALVSVAVCLALFERSENRLSSMLLHDKAELERYATEDTLTGTLNDQTLFEHMQQRLAESGPDSAQRVVCLIVNNYRDIAQHFGNETADAVLAATASRLQQQLAAGATLGRCAINEFIIHVSEEMDDVTFALMLAKIRRLHLKAVTPSDGSRFRLDLRIGSAVCVGATLSPREMIDRARLTIKEHPAHEA